MPVAVVVPVVIVIRPLPFPFPLPFPRGLFPVVEAETRGNGSRDRGPMQQQSATLPAKSSPGFSWTGGLSVRRSLEFESPPDDDWCSFEFLFFRRSCDSSLVDAGGMLSFFFFLIFYSNSFLNQFSCKFFFFFLSRFSFATHLRES